MMLRITVQYTFGLIFWGPTYLTTRGDLVSLQRGYIFAMYDVGSGPGSLILGAITDRTSRRGLVLALTTQNTSR